MTSSEEEIKKSARLRKIMQVMRKYHFVSNFYHQTNPQAICQALQELGPTFIKLGQILSTRPDLVSPSYIKELRQLQDQVKTDPYSVVEQTFKDETGKNIDEVFASFEQTPFASASIGQVHHAKLKDGTAVVVKVQHPEVGALVNTDLALLRKAVILFKYVPQDIAVVDLNKVIDELSASLLSEVNTLDEVRNGEEFYKLNNGNGPIRVPKVYAKYCAPKILVNEDMPGKSIRYLFGKDNDNPQVVKNNHDIAITLVNNFLKQVFVDHFFHADPHPGNILIYNMPNDNNDQDFSAVKHIEKTISNTTITYEKQQELPNYRIVYLDFGMMGQLTPAMANSIANIVITINTKDTRKIGKAVLAVCNRTGDVDENAFYKELGAFIQPYFSTGLGNIDFVKMLYQIVQLCKKNHLQMRGEVTMLIKAFGTLESSVARLDPEISMLEVAQSFGRRYLKRNFNWRSALDSNLMNLFLAGQASSKFPEKINELIDTFVSGDAKVDLQYKNEQRVLKQIERLMNRFMIAIILAAVILGSSLLVEGTSPHSHIYRLGVSGYIIAIIIIILLILTEVIHRWRTWRKKR
ncbi:AarF/ABC1/UbiB kinase family protein [Limosilactobacillus sp. STM2_1]|uniref:AarF/ABC1/UbiB kinase family protein n=1 Tax=Limosilactobacillus rudii TaxID=2759755 RepID=A0A7W3UJI1_9LACO|nr:AarF/UbiB family protein [Limosilactobacillus rudii]MBB1078704.1 AarF/ABC1/UbiB kinase family protein [Limosilactobacillus rudii]MBB1096728.1 AarF/ABC1/UbiB kinase family protein [Limosilactobacillus rudii]MCD7135600.1 AarF/UbiB family protein [Limosilactobacillus rudii]